MKNFKKLILLAVLTLGMHTFSNNVFTLDGYTFGTPTAFNFTQENTENTQELIFSSSDTNVSDKINKTIKKNVNDFTKDKDSYTVVQITASNSKFLSVLITNIKGDVFKYKGLAFDVNTGNELKISDLFIPNAYDGLSNLLSERLTQYGVSKIRSFKGINSVSSFYLEEDSITFIFNKNVATKDNDGVFFASFFLQPLQGALK